MVIRIHPTAEVSDKAKIGDGTSIWHQAQIRENAQLGNNCIISKGVYVDAGVSIGNNVKIQNYVSVYHGVTIEDGVFVGPHVCFTNDLNPRSINVGGSLKAADDWVLTRTLVKLGSALGANSTIVCGVSIGDWAMVGAGSVVTRDVPAYGLVLGNPARLRGFVCPCGHRLEKTSQGKDPQGQPVVIAKCTQCGMEIKIPAEEWGKI